MQTREWSVSYLDPSELGDGMKALRMRSSVLKRKRHRPRAAYPVPNDSQATLTVVTGRQAGSRLALHGTPVTIGRAADADLVIEDPGVGAHHIRVAQAPNGSFYVVDLSSANGTFVDADRVGIALLRDGDLLRLGPMAEIRFAVIPSSDDRGAPVAASRPAH